MVEARSNNNYTTSEEPILPSRIMRLIDDFTAGVELKAARVAAGNTPEGELEKEFHAVLQAAKGQSPERFASVQRQMARPIELYRTSRRFAAYAHIDLNEPDALETVDLAEIHRARVSPFATSWVHIPVMVDGLVNPDRLRDPLLPQAGYSTLNFYVSKVKCVEETDEWGDDEIYLGANFVDETGDASYYWFNVSSEFDTSEVVDYGYPGKHLQYFNLSEGGTKFPKIYTATLTMVEKDLLKVKPWFKDLHEKIKVAVKQLLEKLGFVLGSLIGLGEIGALVGTIVAKITHWFMDWFISIIGNDYMGTFITQATINSYSGSWVTTDPYASWSRKYRAHGGHYHVWYAWQLAK